MLLQSNLTYLMIPLCTFAYLAMYYAVGFKYIVTYTDCFNIDFLSVTDFLSAAELALTGTMCSCFFSEARKQLLLDEGNFVFGQCCMNFDFAVFHLCTFPRKVCL